MEDGYVPATGDLILEDEGQIGRTTGATFGHTVGSAIALGYVPVSLCEPCTRVAVQGRGALYPAAVAQRSLYDPLGGRLRS